MKKLIIALICCPVFVFSQDADSDLGATILQKDSLFWVAYNNCDVAQMANFFTNDIEFYHDKGGITLGVEELSATFQKNICSQRDKSKLRREAVPGSVRVFPMMQSDKIYGAILSGDHMFYQQPAGEQERATGIAKFTHLWILDKGAWKMKRVLSYDHQPAPYSNKRTEQKVSKRILEGYAGTYEGAQVKKVIVTPGDGFLSASIGDKASQLYPESNTLFFMKERDLTFEFSVSAGSITKIIVRERGDIVDELARVATSSSKQPPN